MSLYFVIGRMPAESGYTPLQNAIKDFYQKRLPAGIKIFTDRWDKRDGMADRICAAIRPNERMVLVGHSFGGCALLEIIPAIVKRGRKVDFLGLFDPVSYIWWGPEANKDPKTHQYLTPPPWNGAWTGNTWDFILPAGITAAYCAYREAKEEPWSAHIRGGLCPYRNFKYTPDPKATVDAAHSWPVWNGDQIGIIRKALTGQYVP